MGRVMPETPTHLQATIELDEGDWQSVADALDMLGVALANHGHVWTPEERVTYQKAVHACMDGLHIGVRVASD